MCTKTEHECCLNYRPLPLDCLFLTSSTVRRLVGMPLRSAQRGQAQSPSASSSHSTPMHNRWKLRGQLSHSARGLPSGWCICIIRKCCRAPGFWVWGGGGALLIQTGACFQDGAFAKPPYTVQQMCPSCLHSPKSNDVQLRHAATTLAAR